MISAMIRTKESDSSFRLCELLIHQSHYSRRFGMFKKFLALLAVAIVVLGFLAFRSLEAATEDVIRRIGITDHQAKESIFSSFSGMYLSIPNIAALKRVAHGDRAEIVAQIGDYAKRYSKSPEFLKAYMDIRNGRKPDQPEKPRSNAEDERRGKEEMEKNIAQMEKNLKSMPAETQKMMQGVITQMRQQMEERKKSKKADEDKRADEARKMAYDAQMQKYDQDLAKWNKDYPESPSPMVRRWLKEFLVVSGDVDFSAKLQDDGGRKTFTNREYEQKSDQWKMCFRAGKETIEAGRAYTKQWLRELGGE